MQQAKQTDPNVIVLRGRLSYPTLFKPERAKDAKGDPTGPPKYSCTVILDKTKDKDQIIACKNLIRRICEEAWKNKTVRLESGVVLTNGTAGTVMLSGTGLCLRDGIAKADKEGYGDGVMFVSMGSYAEDKKGVALPPPQVLVKRNGVMVPLKPEEGLLYGGCDVLVSARLYAQDNDFGRRINAGLRAVVWAGHNEPFGGISAVNVEEEFGSLDVPEDTGTDAVVHSEAATQDEGW